jgi:hypothetical protein
MRICVLLGSSLVATMFGAAVVRAADLCCDGEALPKVERGLPAVPFVIPPTGYTLDPSDARLPLYLLNGPFGWGFAASTYARRTFSEGGYAFSDAYPFYDPLWGGYAPAAVLQPWPDPAYFARPFGAPPFTAYRYRPAPGARIIHLEDSH